MNDIEDKARKLYTDKNAEEARKEALNACLSWNASFHELASKHNLISSSLLYPSISDRVIGYLTSHPQASEKIDDALGRYAITFYAASINERYAAIDPTRMFLETARRRREAIESIARNSESILQSIEKDSLDADKMIVDAFRMADQVSRMVIYDVPGCYLAKAVWICMFDHGHLLKNGFKLYSLLLSQVMEEAENPRQAERRESFALEERTITSKYHKMDQSKKEEELRRMGSRLKDPPRWFLAETRRNGHHL